MCFIGPQSCTPYIEWIADTRLKIEVTSGRADIVLEGGDINKARKSVAEVLQKKKQKTHGELIPCEPLQYIRRRWNS